MWAGGYVFAGLDLHIGTLSKFINGSPRATKSLKSCDGAYLTWELVSLLGYKTLRDHFVTTIV